MKLNLLVISLLIFLNVPLYPCTIFIASKGDQTLAGNNEDFIDPETNVWFLPKETGKFGRIYFGFGIGFPQGGMNDQGLFFDYAALPPSTEYISPEKKIYEGSLVEKAMEECSSVDQVFELFNSHDRQHMVTYQLLFGDKNGKSVIIEKDTMILNNESYQICTNFKKSLNEESPYSIDRYRIVESMLKDSEKISVDLFRSILAKVHQEPGQKQGSPTQYSTIYDLKKKLVYLYHFHNYADVYIIDLAEELKKGMHSYYIPSLFEPLPFAFEQYAKRSKILKRTAISVDPSIFDDYVGEYQLIPLPALKLKIRKKGQELYCLLSGLGEFQIFPEAGSKYFFKVADYQIEFQKNDKVVTDLTFIMYGSKLPAKRIN